MAYPPKSVAETQRIARAEMFLCEQAAHVLSQTAIEIARKYQVKIDEMIIRFQPAATRGPEPEVHCVILSARIEEDGSLEDLPRSE